MDESKNIEDAIGTQSVVSELITSTQEKKEANVAWKGDSPTKLVKEAFERGDIKSGQNVIDEGCGFGRNANFLESQGVYVIGININKEELAVAKNKAIENNLSTNFVEASATLLPIAKSSCDVAIDSGCTHMLSSKEDQIKAEKEQARVVKPGGLLLYFGFSKDHPSAAGNPDSPMYRSLEDIQEMYEEDFEIVRSENIEWPPSPEEGANFDFHRGINVIMRRK